MPWTAKDAESKTKAADTPKKQKTWAKIANSRQKTCLANGGEQDACEKSAIRVANAMLRNMGEQELDGEEEIEEMSEDELKEAFLSRPFHDIIADYYKLAEQGFIEV